MRITKGQLKKIIREEKKNVLKEQADISHQATLLSALDQGISAVESVEKELYGLVDPGLGMHSQGTPLGDELGKQLAAAVLELNQAFEAVESYFNSQDESQPTKLPHHGVTATDSEGRVMHAKGGN